MWSSSGPSTTSWPSQLSPLLLLQSATLLKSCDRHRKLHNPRITPLLKVAMSPLSGSGLPEPTLVTLPLLSDAVYKVRIRVESKVQVLIDLDAPKLKLSAWNRRGRQEHFGATTVAVTCSIPGRVYWTIKQYQGDVALRHFAASESRAVNSTFEGPTNAVECLLVSIVDILCSLRKNSLVCVF
jgi:hypothetical protein